MSLIIVLSFQYRADLQNAFIDGGILSAMTVSVSDLFCYIPQFQVVIHHAYANKLPLNILDINIKYIIG